LGGGTGSLSFPRNQRENTHPTGTPKFCGDAGAACGTFSLNRGADFLHAPARLSATNGAQTRDAFSVDLRDVTADQAWRYDERGNAGCGYHVPGGEGRPPDLNRSFYVPG